MSILFIQQRQVPENGFFRTFTRRTKELEKRLEKELEKRLEKELEKELRD